MDTRILKIAPSKGSTRRSYLCFAPKVRDYWVLGSPNDLRRWWFSVIANIFLMVSDVMVPRRTNHRRLSRNDGTKLVPSFCESLLWFWRQLCGEWRRYLFTEKTVWIWRIPFFHISGTGVAPTVTALKLYNNLNYSDFKFWISEPGAVFKVWTEWPGENRSGFLRIGDSINNGRYSDIPIPNEILENS